MLGRLAEPSPGVLYGYVIPETSSVFIYEGYARDMFAV